MGFSPRSHVHDRQRQRQRQRHSHALRVGDDHACRAPGYRGLCSDAQAGKVVVAAASIRRQIRGRAKRIGDLTADPAHWGWSGDDRRSRAATGLGWGAGGGPFQRSQTRRSRQPGGLPAVGPAGLLGLGRANSTRTARALMLTPARSAASMRTDASTENPPPWQRMIALPRNSAVSRAQVTRRQVRKYAESLADSLRYRMQRATRRVGNLCGSAQTWPSNWLRLVIVGSKGRDSAKNIAVVGLPIYASTAAQ